MRRLILYSLLLLLLLFGLLLNGFIARRSTPPQIPVAPAQAHGQLMANIDLAGLDGGEVEERLRQVAADGMAIVRLRLPWNELQPEPDDWRWEVADRSVAAAQKVGLKIVLLLDGSPAWARDPIDADNALAPPHDVRDFGAFATEVEARYGNAVAVYQIWDEPNIAPHWGNRLVDPRGYFRLLREGANSIHRADPEAAIMLASVAPTTADDGANLPDIGFLDQLYALGADEYFDIAAAAAYGFDQPPTAAPAPDRLNFRRPELLYQVMRAHGDAQTPLWITAWGWWTAPAGAPEQQSPWAAIAPDLLPSYQREALHLANTQWPWAGPLAWIDYTLNPGDDPIRLGLVERSPTGDRTPAGETLATLAAESYPTGTGSHPADLPSIRYQFGAWRVSPPAADPDHPGAELTLEFEGTALALEIQGGDYWATLDAWIDGQPAPLLPRDDKGNAFIVLHDPDNAVRTVPLADSLAPGLHELRLRASGGWGQWPLRRIIVDHQPWPRPWPGLPITAVLVVALVVTAYFWLRPLRSAEGKTVVRRLRLGWDRLAEGYRERVGGWGFPLILLLTLIFYLAPTLSLTLLALIPVLIVLALRLEMAPALALVAVPFYVLPKSFAVAGIPLHEFIIWLAFGLWVLYWLLYQLGGVAEPDSPARACSMWRISGLDVPVLLLLLVALFSTLNAERLGFAVYDFRTVFLTPVLFYWLIIRTRAQRSLDVSLLSDAFVLGAVLVSLLGLGQFFGGGADFVEGVPRISSVYGSANNLALYLGRVFPLLIAVIVLGASPRRWLYVLALIPIAIAAFLTFSKGLILISIPASLLLLALLEPRTRKTVLALFVLGILALLPFLGTTRFTDLLNTGSGTTFLRLQLWQSAWRMFLDHPWLGVGPDNFLYAYRSTYVLPSAWEELNLSHPHNLFLDLLTRVGLLGFLAGIWLLGATIYGGFKQLGWVRASALVAAYPYLLGLLVGLIAGLLHGLIDNSMFLVDLGLLTYLVIAVVERVKRERVSAVRTE